MESAITVKGQATIPKAIREHLRLKPGDRVKFFAVSRDEEQAKIGARAIKNHHDEDFGGSKDLEFKPAESGNLADLREKRHDRRGRQERNGNRH